jgi:UDP-N-acetylmuramyl tripeptide synthase
MLDEGAARLEAIHGNYHYIESNKPYTVAVDYAPNDSAVLKVSDTAHQLAKRRLIVVVEAENLQPGTIDTVSKKAARTILVSGSAVAEKRGSLEHVNTVETAVDRVLKTARKDDTVLFAGPMFVDKFDDIQGAITINTSEES